MKIIPESATESLLSEKFKDIQLSFKCYSCVPDEVEDLWTHKIIELYKKNTAVGYIKLMFYDRTKVQYPINNVLDYFAVVKSNKNPLLWIKDQNIDFFNQFGFKNPINDIKTKYLKEYNDFNLLWENKPTVEIVRIYDELDKKCTKHYDFPSITEERVAQNFKNQGLGKTLYLAAALWMQQEKKSVYSSIKQTKDGQNMWKSIEKNPNFILSCETISKTINGQPVELARSSISLK